MNIDQFDSYNRRRINEPLSQRRDLSELSIFNIDEERDEKPWQHMLKRIRKNRSGSKESITYVPSIAILLVLGIYLTLGYLTQLIEDDMPRVVFDKDVQPDVGIWFPVLDADTFSEESAKRYLHQILGNEPRVAGMEYHYKKTRDLKLLLDTIADRANIPVRTDWQFVSGDYFLEFKIPHVNCYRNLSNVVAVLEGESGFDGDRATGTSLLVNCHYDSVPFAIGASDNGVFCAVMLETLSKLSRRKQKFKHNIIFLFNGAEENPLQGSHGFLKHPWARGITNVVNLDAAGMNGKPAVFQVSDPRLMSVYQRAVSRPNAQGFGEFLFRTGIIPSDTDFRIWRDFGDIHGMDIAFVKWGNVYHTRNDRPELILDGVVQNAGNMLLNLVKELADTVDLKNKLAPTQVVYFDYLNVFLATYSAAAARAADGAAAICALLTVAYYLWLVGYRRSSLLDLLSSVLGRVVSAAIGILAVVVLVLVMAITTKQLRYLSKPWLVVPLYWIPYFVVSYLISINYESTSRKCGLSRALRTQQAMAATRLLLAVSLLTLSAFPGVTSRRYVLSVPLLIMSVGSLISMTVVKYFRLKAWHHLALEIMLSVPSTMFLMSLSLRLDAIMLPTAGRMPTKYPDYIVGGLNLMLAVLLSATVSGIELLFSRKRLWLPIGLISSICLVLMFTPMTIYEDDGIATQRHYWFHSEIITYDVNGTEVERKSGVLVTRQDAYTLTTVGAALQLAGLALHNRSDFAADCAAHVFCNLPLYRPRFAQHLHDVLFLYTDPPAKFDPEPSLTASRSCDHTTCTVTCLMIGPQHNTLTFFPQPGVNLTSWSFSSPLEETSQFLNRSLYVVTEATCTYSKILAPLEFTLTFNVTKEQQTKPLVEISHHAHKISHPEDFTDEYRRLLNAAPKYFNIASTLNIRSNYIF